MSMYYVYILRSEKNRDRFYVGFSTDLERRLKGHSNPVRNSYTQRYAPWELEAYIAFKNQRVAEEFELYLKSHSGRAFLRRRLMATK